MKIHYENPIGGITLCRLDWENQASTTKDSDKVTCKGCIKILSIFALRQEERRDAHKDL